MFSPNLSSSQVQLKQIVHSIGFWASPIMESLQFLQETDVSVQYPSRYLLNEILMFCNKLHKFLQLIVNTGTISIRSENTKYFWKELQLEVLQHWLFLIRNINISLNYYFVLEICWELSPLFCDCFCQCNAILVHHGKLDCSFIYNLQNVEEKPSLLAKYTTASPFTHAL